MVYPYVAETYGDGLMYFADDGQGNLIIANAREFPESRTVVSLSEWDRHKLSYGDREDILRYNDIVNAAWQHNSLNFGSLDRDSAVISKMEMGYYFPRIWRGLYSEDGFQVQNAISPRYIYGRKYIGSVVATTIIFDEMRTLFRYIEPQTKNNEAYGHKLRELLIIACIEVETLWRSVLEDNSSAPKVRYNTNDYCTLIEPMRLKEWSVVLMDHPDFGELSPFSNWDPSEPTKSLDWYDAYNAVKHHREENFERASLIYLVNSVSALHILQAAQWGPDMYDRFYGNEKSPFRTFRLPKFDISEIYIENLIENGVTKPIRYFDHFQN